MNNTKSFLTQMSNAPLTHYTVINTLTGEMVSSQIIENQLHKIMTIVNETGESFIRECWTETVLDKLKSKTDDTGAALPGVANAAADRLGLRPVMPDVHLSSRVERFIKSLAISQLRAHVARRDAYNELRSEDEAVGYTSELSQNMERSMKNYFKKNDTLPENYTDYCKPSFPKNLLRMGSVDRQYAYGEYDKSNHTYVMSMNVNRTWYSLVFNLPEHLRTLSITKVCLPNIRFVKSKFRFDVCVEHSIYNPVPAIEEKVAYKKPLTVMGIDLGHSNTAVCSIVKSDTMGNLTYHENAYSYDDLGQRAKLDRLRSQGYHLRKKLRSYESLEILEDKVELLSRENDHVESRRTNLGKALAYDLAHYVLNLAKIFEVDAISLEDLKFTSNMTKSLNKNLNVANSTWSHSQIATVMRQVLNKHGILVIHVNARNTSKSCPSCDMYLTRSNYHVTACVCGINMDRDQAASISIAKRGLLSLLSKSRLPRNIIKASPRLLKIPKIGINQVKPSRDKSMPTPSQVNKRFSSRCKYPDKPKTSSFPLSQSRNGVICSIVSSYMEQNRITVGNTTMNIIVKNVVLIQ